MKSTSCLPSACVLFVTCVLNVLTLQVDILVEGAFLSSTPRAWLSPSSASSLAVTKTAVDDERSSTAITNDDADCSFESLGLSPESLNAIEKHRSWITPTPVQQLTIPRLLDDNVDTLWCEAPTGSGKTLAFSLPLLQRIAATIESDSDSDRASESATGKITSLVLCPTRELCIQIGTVVQSLSSYMTKRGSSRKFNRSLRTQMIYGGVPIEPQISALARCVNEDLTIDVLVATPGRLADLLTHYSNISTVSNSSPDTEGKSASDAALEARLLGLLDSKKKDTVTLEEIQELNLDRIDDDGRGSIHKLLQSVQYFVLDEADRLLSRAFEAELDAVLDLLPQKQKRPLKTWLFSATFPKQIEPRVDSVLARLGNPQGKRPVHIISAQSDRVLEQDDDISSTLRKKLDNTQITKSAQQQIQVGPKSTIHLRAIRLKKPDRTQALRKLIEANGRKNWDRVLVFVATRYSSEHVARKLRRYNIRAQELHGKLDQEARQRRLRSFSGGQIQVLVATDIAARGLDIVGLPVVVNYDLPRSTAEFVHRVGRTGRAGNKGSAISFITAQNEAQFDLIEKRHLPDTIERETLPGFEIDEEQWYIQKTASQISLPGSQHSTKGLAHDQMHGGVKGNRKSKKDKLREKAAREAKNKENDVQNQEEQQIEIPSIEIPTDTETKAKQQLEETLPEAVEVETKIEDDDGNEAESSFLNKKELSEWTVAELKEQLKSLDLTVSGKKGDLVDRIFQYQVEELSTWKVSELKEQCRTMGKPISGSKKELVERILE